MRVNNINFGYFDYKSKVNDIIHSIKTNDYDFILLDNADLYMNYELVTLLKSIESCVLLSMKSYFDFDLYDLVNYKVTYSNNTLSCRRII